MKKSRTPAVLASIYLLALAACTAKEAANDSATAAGDTTATVAASTTGAASNVVTITATDYAFAVPEQIPAGLTTFQLVDSGKEPHHASLFKLTDGKTVADVTNALKTMKPGTPPPAWLVPAGGPNAIVPGGEANATVSLEPGNYALLCFVPDAQGRPHFALGMVKGFTVTPAASSVPATLPPADITLRLSDYKFEWSKPLTAGRHTIRVETVPGQPHEVTLFQLGPGKTVKDLQVWIQNSFKGEPPAKPIGGIAPLASGIPSTFTIDLPPGEYAAVCFLEDAKDGKPHFVHGMIEAIKIT